MQPSSLINIKGCPNSKGALHLASDTRFLYDDWNLIGEYEMTANGLTLKATHLWGTDLSASPQGAGGVGGLLCTSLVDEGVRKSYHPAYDGNGNISAWVSATGQLISRTDYSPFGQVIARHKLTLPNDDTAERLVFGFSTKYTDQETALLYYGYRYYDPATGRWSSRDPIEERGGVNLYGFVGNDGVNKVDVLGKITHTLIVGEYGDYKGESKTAEFTDISKKEFETYYKACEKLIKALKNLDDNTFERLKKTIDKKEYKGTRAKLIELLEREINASVTIHQNGGTKKDTFDELGKLAVKFKDISPQSHDQFALIAHGLIDDMTKKFIGKVVLGYNDWDNYVDNDKANLTNMDPGNKKYDYDVELHACGLDGKNIFIVGTEYEVDLKAGLLQIIFNPIKYKSIAAGEPE